MNFLQLPILWGLPLILIPVIVHLLNRMRYKTVPWATLMFLLAAVKHSTRQARLREWLILLLRTLAVAALVLALARPMVGGWLGWAVGAAPDTILLVLDRSASMEAQDPVLRQSKRQTALDRFAEAAREFEGQTRFVFIENATLKPQEMAGLAALKSLSSTGPSDAAASIPALLEAAFEYIAENQSGQAEIWLASDQQLSNWQTDSRQWEQVRTRYASFRQPVRLRLLAMTQNPADNVSVAVREATRRRTPGGYELALNVEFNRTGTGSQSFPLTLVHEGARSQVNVTLEQQQQSFQCSLDLGSRTNAGWGWVELPADSNPGDNLSFFTYAEDLHLKAAVVATSEESRRILPLAAAPAPQLLNQSAELTVPGDRMKLTDISLLLWQENAPSGTVANVIRDFVEEGGVAVYLPAGAGEENKAPVAYWQKSDGVLANSKEGKALPLNELEVARRVIPDLEGPVLASFEDGKPLLVRKPAGKGAYYAFATLPDREWSTLAEGPVLVPMFQRMLQEGGRRLSQAATSEVGLLQATRIECLTAERTAPTPASPGVHAGVYRADNRLVAVNRPAAEDLSEAVTEDQIKTAMGPVPFRVFEDKGGAKAAMQSEIWRWMLIAMLLFLTGEAFLALPETVRTRTWVSPEQGERFGQETSTPGTKQGSPA